MINRKLTVLIDKEKCIGCGACIPVCPAKNFSLKDGKAELSGAHSLHCGHCEAVCPTGAISSSGVEEEAQNFKSFAFDKSWLSPDDCDINQVVRLMGARRSCRDYTEEPVSRDILEDLVKAAIMAPSGTNSQRWTFTIIPDRESLLTLGKRIRTFFKKLNGLAESWLLRNGIKLLGQFQLDDYYKRYYKTIKEGIAESETKGADRLWHGARAAIIVGSQAGASCGQEDALLAAQNILLAAHSLGLGSCLIGFAVAAMGNDKAIQTSLGIPKEEKVYAVVALGHTKEKYHLCAGRKMPLIRYWQKK